ncbi:DUF2269 family protein [Actinomadura adrarensis]|uniref:DUF2269 family protein n=1 Tax=Actinomadura adrarensis TaxID=1819600 RepID=A0ABW3CMR8_9ACTN
MSTSDRLLLILHIGFAIFTLGPLTAATSVTPRYIRKRDAAVVRYLNRNTRLYGMGTLTVFLFGLFLGQGELAQAWLVVSITLFVVALALLLLVERDQRKAVHLLEVAAAQESPAPEPSEQKTEAEEEPKKETTKPAEGGDIAQVERGRIAAISGVIALIWVVILVLMVWNGS